MRCCAWFAEGVLCRGIIVMIGSTVSILLAITWGGLQFPWTSAHVLVPLIVGALGIIVFFVLEMYWLKGPTVSVLRCMRG